MAVPGDFVLWNPSAVAVKQEAPLGLDAISGTPLTAAFPRDHAPIPLPPPAAESPPMT